MKKISIIDDNNNLLTTLSISLRLHGFQIISFACPVKALEYHAKNPADLYLLDVKMPKMTGIEFYMSLCKKFNTKSIPTIFLTGYNDYEAECIKKFEASDYVTKPFNTEGLIARIERVLNKNKPHSNKNILHLGNLQMDDEKFECKWFNKPILLTKREYIILKSLAGRPRVVFTRQQLLEICYNSNLNISYFNYIF